jgi:hypothetical protein
MPFSISIPRPDIDDDHLFKTGAMIGSIFFVMERYPQHGDRFEVFVNSAEYLCDKGKEWYSKLLLPPPFVRKTPSQSRNRTEITAYAVVGGGSHICVSVEGAAAGTYWMDTASYEWTKIGEWTLPFYGKVEYVPELDLWFGISADAKALAAADLSSAMDSRPRLVVDPWKELDDSAAPEECQDAQLVNLGSGRFCIARFFGTPAATTDGDSGGDDDELAGKSSVVLTGVEVAPHAPADGSSCNGERKLQVMKHKSRRLNNIDDATVEAVF